MIKTIICDGCGIETNTRYGYPEEPDYCKECYIKNQTDYIQRNIDSKELQISRLNDGILKLKNQIKALPNEVE